MVGTDPQPIAIIPADSGGRAPALGAGIDRVAVVAVGPVLHRQLALDVLRGEAEVVVLPVGLLVGRCRVLPAHAGGQGVQAETDEGLGAGVVRGHHSSGADAAEQSNQYDCERGAERHCGGLLKARNSWTITDPKLPYYTTKLIISQYFGHRI